MKKFLAIAAFLASSLSIYAATVASVVVTFNGNSATVDIPAGLPVTASVSGAHVTLTSTTMTDEYSYILKGSTDNGSFTLIGMYKLELQLAGVSINNPQGPAIDIECTKRTDVKLVSGTVNNITDGFNGSHKAAMYFTGRPEFKSAGVLNVKGNTGHAISAKEAMELKATTGTINVLGAVKDGLHCGTGKQTKMEDNYFLMLGGEVNISGCQSNGIDSDTYGIMTFSGGRVIIDSGKSDSEALNCDGELTVDGSAEIHIRGSHYECNPSDFKYDMTAYVSFVKSDGPINYPNYQIGAYRNGVGCATSDIVLLPGGVRYAQMRIYSNDLNVSDINICGYNVKKDRENVALGHITFAQDGVLGSPSSPVEYTLLTADVAGLAAMIQKAITSGEVTLGDIQLMKNRILRK